jgi:hypothetical protein
MTDQQINVFYSNQDGGYITDIPDLKFSNQMPILKLSKLPPRLDKSRLCNFVRAELDEGRNLQKTKENLCSGPCEARIYVLE